MMARSRARRGCAANVDSLSTELRPVIGPHADSMDPRDVVRPAQSRRPPDSSTKAMRIATQVTAIEPVLFRSGSRKGYGYQSAEGPRSIVYSSHTDGKINHASRFGTCCANNRPIVPP
jgi:hypothetical protein